MRHFFTRRIPDIRRVLLVESGARHLSENLISHWRQACGPDLRIDLVTCYAGSPAGFDASRGAIYRVSAFQGSAGRARLCRELCSNDYSVIGIICSAEPVMTKWKWLLAARVPAKLFILNENGDYFWVDRSNWKLIVHFVLFRAGLTGGDAVRTLGRLALFPFTLLYLLLYAAFIHLRRKVHA